MRIISKFSKGKLINFHNSIPVIHYCIFLCNVRIVIDSSGARRTLFIRSYQTIRTFFRYWFCFSIFQTSKQFFLLCQYATSKRIAARSGFRFLLTFT